MTSEGEEWRMGWQLAIGVAVGLVVVWVALIITLYVLGRREGDRTTITEALRLLPDVLRLLRRLAADETLPRGIRIRLWLLIGYLAFPFDLVPDVIPVVGYADDAIIVGIALRSVAHAAGKEALDRHWPGSPEGLRAVKRLASVGQDRANPR